MITIGLLSIAGIYLFLRRAGLRIIAKEQEKAFAATRQEAQLERQMFVAEMQYRHRS